MANVIYIVRHGATKLNNQTDASEDRIRGWKDVPLAEEGRKEAQAAGLKLKPKNIGAIVASDLSRAHETAAIIGKIVGVKPVASRGLRPWNLGTYAGTSTKEALPKIADYARNKPDEAVPEGESFNAFKERAFAGLADAIESNQGKVLVIVTHHRNERLYEAWEKAGRPEDLSIDMGTFLQKGDPPGGIKTLAIGDVEKWEPSGPTSSDGSTPPTKPPITKSGDSDPAASPNPTFPRSFAESPNPTSPHSSLKRPPATSSAAMTKPSESEAASPSPAGKNGPSMQNPYEATAPAEDQKVTKAQAHYGLAKAGSGDRCATCKSFRPPNDCVRVEGRVAPAGWCKLYEEAEGESEVMPAVRYPTTSDTRPPPSTAAGAMNVEALSHGRAIAGAKALHAVGHITAKERDKHIGASQKFISKRKAFGSWAP